MDSHSKWNDLIKFPFLLHDLRWAYVIWYVLVYACAPLNRIQINSKILWHCVRATVSPLFIRSLLERSTSSSELSLDSSVCVFARQKMDLPFSANIANDCNINNHTMWSINWMWQTISARCHLEMSFSEKRICKIQQWPPKFWQINDAQLWR